MSEYPRLSVTRSIISAIQEPGRVSVASIAGNSRVQLSSRLMMWNLRSLVRLTMEKSRDHLWLAATEHQAPLRSPWGSFCKSGGEVPAFPQNRTVQPL